MELTTKKRGGLLLGVLLLAGCATVPTGPSVMALPGTGKSFDQFRFDDAECRQYATMQIGGGAAAQEANDAGVRSAALATVIGAVAGAAIGGRDSAGIGAGTGLLIGSMAGGETSERSGRGSQRNYDHAYVQCMYAKGQRVPVSRDMANSLPKPMLERSDSPAPAPAPRTTPPPPPSGYPPPPPPNAPR